MIWISIIETIILLVCIGIYFTVDRIITHNRLSKSQTAWDEYCKDMTRKERGECYFDWVEKQREMNGWKFSYFPSMHKMEYNVFDVKIDGISYRGTKKEISEKSGLSLDFLENLGEMPMEIITTNKTCLINVF